MDARRTAPYELSVVVNAWNPGSGEVEARGFKVILKVQLGIQTKTQAG